VMDAKLHGDRVHRGVSSMAPMTQRVMYASQLMSAPTLCEPMFRCNITVSSVDARASVYHTLRGRRGVIVDVSELADDEVKGLDEDTIVAYLPVAESFGFSGQLSEASGGHTFVTMMFSHWCDVDGDVSQPDSRAAKLVSAIRARKGLAKTLPIVSDYHDDIKQ